MKYLRWLWTGFAALAACGYLQNAQALEIELRFATPGERCFTCDRGRFESSAFITTGGGSIEGVFNAAADIWESLLHDDRHFRITVGSAGMSPGTVAAAAITASDGFNEIALNTLFRHFADPTPLQNEEFAGYTETAADFGGGLINSGRAFTTMSVFGIDLLSTALHEIGHVLGVPIDVHSGNVFDILNGPFAGTRLPCSDVTCGHLSFSLPNALMNPNGGPRTGRALIIGADLLFVATDGGFQDFDQSVIRVAAVPVAGTLWLWVLAFPLLLVFAGAKKRRWFYPAPRVAVTS